MSKMVRALALSLVMVLMLGACGGDDSANEDNDDQIAEQPSDTPSEEPSHEEFCSVVVEAEDVVAEAFEGGPTESVEPLLQTVESTAPDEVSADVATVVATVREGMKTQKGATFDSVVFRRSDEVVDRWVGDNCGFESVEVTGVEFAFEGIPQTLPAGITSFTFSNAGQQVHEMIMFRIKDRSTVEDLLKLPQKEAQKHLEFVGASFGPPGASDTEPKALGPGRYAVLCFIPVGATSAEALESGEAKGPPHALRGMHAEFTVE